MKLRDFYEVLGVSRSATDAEIKKAYRRMARKYHPDVNSHDEDAETKFKEATQAYEVLSDEQKRATYDRFGHTGRYGGTGGPGPGGFGQGFGQGFGFEDIFDAFFDGFGGGRQRRRSPAQSGEDLGANLTISFKDAAFGVDREIEILKPSACGKCGGSGLAEGASPQTCGTCGGQGVVSQTQQTVFGNFSRTGYCPTCDGTGQIFSEVCRGCHGEGRVPKRSKVKIKVPAGIVEGMRLKLEGHGTAGRRGGPPGDLYVDIAVKPDKVFSREGNDVVLSIPLSFSHAALGGDIKVPTLDGEEVLTVPPGTQSGSAFRIKGKGIPFLNRRGRGDQVVETVVRTPTHLTEEERELFARLSELAAERGPEHSGIFDKIKEAFGK